MYEPPRRPDPVALGGVAVAGCLGIGIVMVICGLVAQIGVAMVSLQARGLAQSVIGFAGDIGELQSGSGGSRSSAGGPGAGPTVVLRFDSVESVDESQEPTTAQTPGATPTPIKHVVQADEALSLIAETYGVSVEEILRANGLENPDTIFAGQQLDIPPRR